MAIEVLESFAVMASNTGLARRWTEVSFPTNGVSSTAGRFGGYGVAARDAAAFWRMVLTDQATRITGFAFTPNTMPSNGAIFGLWDGATLQVWINIDSTGHLVAYRGTGTSNVLGTAAGALTTGINRYIEIRATIHNTAGALEVRVDGTAVISVSGVNTRASSNNSSNVARYGWQNSGVNAHDNANYSDLYLLNGSGGVDDDFWGDTRIYAPGVTGAGATTQWTPSAGSNYQCVDERPANDDTDYVADSTVGHIDTYAIADLSLPVGTTVRAVQTSVIAKKSDAGSRSVATVLRSGGTNNAGTTQALSTSYAEYHDIWRHNPDGDVAWTSTTVDALEAGEKMVA